MKIFSILTLTILFSVTGFAQELQSPQKPKIVDIAEKGTKIERSSEEGQRITRIVNQIKADAQEIDLVSATTSDGTKNSKGRVSAAVVSPSAAPAKLRKAASAPGVIMMSDEPSLWEYKKAAVLLTTAELPGPIDLVAQITYGNGKIDDGIFHLDSSLGRGWGFSVLNLIPTNFTPGGPLTVEVFFIGSNYFSRVSSKSNIFGEEESKVPEILSVSEQSLTYTTLITAKGHFQFCRPTVVLDWSIVPDENIVTSDLNRIQINTMGMFLSQNKYRITICQNGECDSYIARHRR